MNRLKRILCALLSVCIISMPVALSAVSAGAESIDSMQQQRQELEQKNQEYQDILDKTQSDINENYYQYYYACCIDFRIPYLFH